MRVAYLVNQYPTVSHSFIRREILALERHGVEVQRIALREWKGDLADPENQLERGRTRYVLRDGAPGLLMALGRMVLTRPVRLLQALALALRMGWRAERLLPVHFIYLAEACRIEPWLRAARVQHLHAHFGTNSAEVAMLVHALGGPQWSFTIHGPKEYDNVQLAGLAEKILRCAFVVAISSYGRSQIYRLVPNQYWPKVKVVHCGLEPAYFATAEGPPPAARRLVCVGRLCEQKGQLLLVEAAQRLAARGIAFELVLAGDGELRAEIEASITRHNLLDKVHVTGWISGAEVREQILAARALVLPSFAEGLPVVIMEAMALRRPVISTFIAGIPELVQPGEHGWLVPAGDVDALVEAMQACLDAPVDMLGRLGEAAHKRVRERHNVDREAAKLAKLFQYAVESGGTYGRGLSCHDPDRAPTSTS
jgi:colanic acid/amylovoran biosynthesis glycosyltransferase